jgi:sugar O-acyltransferase (sialic acid O-acetyltransferase NeuD family)
MKPILVWGATGQCKVIFPLIETTEVVLFDRDERVTSPFPHIAVEHSPEALESWIAANRGAEFVIAMGGFRGQERCDLAHYLESKGLLPTKPLIHPRAWVAETASVGAGSQILGMASVSESVSIGSHCIINTSAVVDHDCSIGDGVHIMPGATLAGCVVVEEFASIGSGAVVLPRVRIGRSAIVGAGAVVTRDVAPNETVIGVPARPTKNASSKS